MTAPRRLCTLLFVLPLVAIPAFALVSGPELPIADPVIAPRAGIRFTPQVATNGKEYLIVWAEAAEIRAARVDGEGRVLDPAGIRVATNSGTTLAVASDGRDYAIAYNCTNYGWHAQDPSVCLARLDASTGRVDAGERLSLATNAVIASARGRYLVAYQTPYAPSTTDRFIDAVEVAADASVTGTPFRVGVSPYRPDIASNGQDYFVIWSTYAQLKGRLIGSQSEQTFTPVPASWGPSAFAWSAASNGSGFMVVWQHNAGVLDNRYVTELRASSVTSAGAARAAKSVGPVQQTAYIPQVTWDGAKYVVTYTFSPQRPLSPGLSDRNATDIHEVALSADADLVMPPTLLAVREGSEAYSSAASNGTSTLIAWENLIRVDTARIEASFFRTIGATAAPLTIPVSVSWQQNLAGTAAGGNVVVAWEEILGEEQRRTVFLQRLGGGVRPLDGRGIPVGASTRHQLFPAVSQSFVAWSERDLALAEPTAEVFAKRDEETFLLGEAQRDARVAIAETSSIALAVWQSPSGQIVGVRIQRNGGPLDATPFVVSGDDRARNPVIASDGESFLVAWEKEEPCWFECISAPALLYTAAVTSDGAVQPAVKLAELSVTIASVVWNGSDYVVFWNQPYVAQPYGAAPRGFLARRLDRSGLPQGMTIGIHEEAFANQVAWNGREYLVAITGSRGFAPLTAARLDRELRLIDTAGLSNAYVAGTRVALLPDWIGYQTRNDDGISRAVARVLGAATVTKRRAVR